MISNNYITFVYSVSKIRSLLDFKVNNYYLFKLKRSYDSISSISRNIERYNGNIFFVDYYFTRSNQYGKTFKKISSLITIIFG